MGCGCDFARGLIVTKSQSQSRRGSCDWQTIHLREPKIMFARRKRSVNKFLQCKGLWIWFRTKNVVPLHRQNNISINH